MVALFKGLKYFKHIICLLIYLFNQCYLHFANLSLRPDCAIIVARVIVYFQIFSSSFIFYNFIVCFVKMPAVMVTSVWFSGVHGLLHKYKKPTLYQTNMSNKKKYIFWIDTLSNPYPALYTCDRLKLYGVRKIIFRIRRRQVSTIFTIQELNTL